MPFALFRRNTLTTHPPYHSTQPSEVPAAGHGGQEAPEGAAEHGAGVRGGAGGRWGGEPFHIPILAAPIVAAAGGRRRGGRGARGGRGGRSGRGGHINVDVCSSVKAAKYLFKYVYKGADRAMMQVEAGQGPAELQDHRALGAAEASWRMFSVV